MNIDIIGSPFTKKLTEFKNFPFKINNSMEGQSLLSLFSEPYPVDMSALNTVDLTQITNAYRDFNKTHLEKMRESDSELLLIEFSSELNEICRLNNSYFNASSLSLLSSMPDYWTLARIQKFRAFKEIINSFVEFSSKYDKVILLKINTSDRQDSEFLNALYTLIENRLDNILIYTVPDFPVNREMEHAPLEFFDEINAGIKKFRSKNYNDQLLFDEKLENNQLSVFINYVEPREYIYDLYKNGKIVSSSETTTSRISTYNLKEPGKYRIRVNPINSEVESRFTDTYEYSQIDEATQTIKYIELSKRKIDWKIDFLINHYNLDGLIGNPYSYPEGYRNLPVYLLGELENNTDILWADQIINHILMIVEKMDVVYIKQLLSNVVKADNDDSILEFIKYKIEKAIDR